MKRSLSGVSCDVTQTLACEEYVSILMRCADILNAAKQGGTAS